MLYDALLVPNGGLEIYLGKNWSIDAYWMYAWWKSDRVHNYWRTYGGDVELRKWLGSAAKRKPLTGHHIGAYAQIVTYDFELGGRGYLADRWSYAAGVSYGYSLPVAKRLNIDFLSGLAIWVENIRNICHRTAITFGNPPNADIGLARQKRRFRLYG